MDSGKSAISTAFPQKLRDSESILAPILIGYDASRVADAIPAIVETASKTVPPVTLTVQRTVKKKEVSVKRVRGIWAGVDRSPGSYDYFARCIDLAPRQTAQQGLRNWVWHVGVLELDEPEDPPPSDESLAAVRLDVTGYRLENHGVLGARQLALFRHVFVESFLTLDPSARVSGGQRDWQTSWWPSPPEPSTGPEEPPQPEEPTL